MLDVTDLSVSFSSGTELVRAVDGVSFSVGKRQKLGIVGESGCGKTVTALSLLRLIPHNARVGGKVLWHGRDILSLPGRDLLSVRGAQISMIFQNPVSSLNPVFSVGRQVIDVLKLHRQLNAKDAEKEAVRLFEQVKIPAAAKRLYDYPHQFSGGMCQRIMIAMAIAAHPELLIADECTASLDVTIQAQIVELLRELNETLDMSIIMISHDLGVISHVCDYIAVMYLGRIVEYGPTEEVFTRPAHPYTEALLRSIPVPDPGRKRKVEVLGGDIPSPINLPEGCRFAGRCQYKQDKCLHQYPHDITIRPEHKAACYYPLG